MLTLKQKCHIQNWSKINPGQAKEENNGAEINEIENQERERNQ